MNALWLCISVVVNTVCSVTARGCLSSHSGHSDLCQDMSDSTSHRGHSDQCQVIRIQRAAVGTLINVRIFHLGVDWDSRVDECWPVRRDCACCWLKSNVIIKLSCCEQCKVQAYC